MMKKIIEIKIRQHVRDYLNKQIKNLNVRINYTDEIINPFFLALMKSQLKIETRGKLARSLIFEGKIKGLTGSFGSKLQQIAGEFSHENPKDGFHLRIKKEKKIYNVIVVSGPQHNTSNVEKYRSKMENSKKNYPEEIPVFGICYGNKKTLEIKFGKNVVKGLEKEKIIIGREFWEFISGDKNCRDEIIEIIDDEALKFSGSKDDNSIYDALIKNSEGMEEYLGNMYGKDKKKFWKNLFGDIYS